MDKEEPRGLHRSIYISTGAQEAHVILHDDFHHFRLRISHDGSKVTGVQTEAIRYPYSMCPNASDALQDMIGLYLTTRVFEISAALNARLQCTHQFDIAALAVAAAARGESRAYDVFVTDPEDETWQARLTRHDGFRLDWTISNDVVTTPSEISGTHMTRGFTRWAASLSDPDLAEAALVLRRAHFVAKGRARLTELNTRTFAPTRGSCYVMQPERAGKAVRIPTHIRQGVAPLTLDSDDIVWLRKS